MRHLRLFLSLALVCQLTGIVRAQTDGECSVFLDPAQFTSLIIDDVGLDEAADFAIAAPLMDVSPIADGLLTAGEYANSCYFTFAENENPGQSWPTLDNLEDGDADLTVTMHFAHTTEALFVAFDVTDDFLDHDFPANSFQNDGVELFINPDLDIDDAYGIGRFQIFADAAGDGDIELNNRGATAGILVNPDGDPEDGEYYSAGLVRDDESGYVVEFQIPLGSLDTAGGDEGDPIPMKTGDVALINAAIDDNDENDNLGGQTGHHLLWYFDGDTSPFGTGDARWPVALLLSEPVVGGPDGDYDGDGVLGAGDLDAMAQFMKDGVATGDLDGDGDTDANDRSAWIRDLQKSWVGDSNFDGEFNSGDFVTVFTVGKYETGAMAGYAEGDWNGDMVFDSGDFVTAFSDGGFELGPRAATAAVPEPASASLLFLALLGLLGIRRRR